MLRRSSYFAGLQGLRYTHLKLLGKELGSRLPSTSLSAASRCYGLFCKDKSNFGVGLYKTLKSAIKTPNESTVLYQYVSEYEREYESLK